ncbi:hypothetical protein [Streptomyces hilarionis]|uniref:hypothetical protein n=1 Tax=Streptomyces hilarionis TaxID=2839954 RepID=UPI00211A317B|nr:hypothetical protein [Streptomyces hilarionis]MCQ9133829.1 hypothetical protein [Streptomyces hilarionis]
MRRPLALAAVLAAVLLTGGCVSLPAGTAPPPRPAPAAARTPSPVPDPGQAPALTALVATDPSGTPRPHARHRGTASRRLAGGSDAHHRPPRARLPVRPRAGAAPVRPARPRFVAPTGPRRHTGRPARPARPRTARPRQPRPTYDLRTVCGWSHRSPVPPSVRGLCDAYVG